jgi:hypothetical protein
MRAQPTGIPRQSAAELRYVDQVGFTERLRFRTVTDAVDERSEYGAAV